MTSDRAPEATDLPRETAIDPATTAGSALDGKLVAALERTGHALRVLLWDQAKAHGLSPMQVQLLLRLEREPEPRRRVGALAAELDVEAPTVSDAIAALRRKGLVDVAAVEGDRRARRLELSAAGRRTATALAAWDAPVRARLAGEDDGAKAGTYALLLDLLGELRDRGVIEVARSCTTCRFFARAAAGSGAPTHGRCELLDLPLAPADLRVDCAEHQAA